MLRDTWSNQAPLTPDDTLLEGEVTNADVRAAYDDFTYYISGRVDAKANAYNNSWQKRIDEVKEKTGVLLSDPSRHYGPNYELESFFPDQPLSQDKALELLYNPKVRQELDIRKQEKYNQDVQAFDQFVAQNEYLFPQDSIVYKTDNTTINDEVKTFIDEIIANKDYVDARTDQDFFSFDNLQRIAGGVTASITDPTNVAATAASFIFPGSTFATRTLIAAAENAGAEYLIQDEVREWYKEIGIEYGDDEMLRNVAMAAITGATLSGGIEFAGKSIQLSGDAAMKGIEAYRKAEAKLKGTPYVPLNEAVGIETAIDIEKQIKETNLIKDDINDLEHATKLENSTAQILSGNPDGVAKLTPEQLKTIDEVIFDEASQHVEQFSPDDIIIDAKRFQFKTGTDVNGKSTALDGIKKWDPTKSGTVIVWKDKDGKNFIADGHQRLNLAKKLSKEGQKIKINATILRETDGINPLMARGIGARANLANGTANLFDAARALKVDPESLSNLATRSKYVQDAQGIANLSDEVLLAMENSGISPSFVSIIGRNFSDSAEQMSMLKLLQRLEPSNQTKAESIIAQAKEAGFAKRQDVQQGLFGDDIITDTLFMERADILDATLKLINREKQVFSTLVDNSDFIQKYGNKLDKTTNLQRKNLNGEIQETIKHNANIKGEISDELSNIAREVQSGNITVTAAARRFAEGIGTRFRSNRFSRIDASTVRRNNDVEEILNQVTESQVSKQPGRQIEQLEPEEFDIDGLQAKAEGLQQSLEDIDPEFKMQLEEKVDLEKSLEDIQRDQKIIDELDNC